MQEIFVLLLLCLLFVCFCCLWKFGNKRGFEEDLKRISRNQSEIKWNSTFMQENLLFCFCCFACCSFAALLVLIFLLFCSACCFCCLFCLLFLSFFVACACSVFLVCFACYLCCLCFLFCLRKLVWKSTNQREIQCGNSDIKEEFKKSKRKSTFMQEKHLFCFCCCCLCFLFCKYSCGNQCGIQNGNSEIKRIWKRISRNQEEIKWKSRGIKVEFQSGIQKIFK
jgi:hypothetical protein